MPDRRPARLTAGRLTVALAAAVLLALALYASTFVISYEDLFRAEDPLVRSDVARLAPARVERVDTVREVDQLRAVLRDARQRGLKVSISGSRHSQGGHTYTRGGVVLNMRGFNRVRAVDPVALTITVESGTTWDEVQRAIAPRGLALKVMQSSNIFTVGGTLSANAHGRDQRSRIDRCLAIINLRPVRPQWQQLLCWRSDQRLAAQSRHCTAQGTHGFRRGASTRPSGVAPEFSGAPRARGYAQ